MAKEGLGRHLGTLPAPDGLKHYLRTFWIMIVLYNCSITSIKLCFLAQYWRIMAVGKMRIAILVVAGIIGTWALSVAPSPWPSRLRTPDCYVAGPSCS